MQRRISSKIWRNISKLQVVLVKTAASSWLTHKSRRKSSCSTSVWSFQLVKFPDFLPKMKRKPSLVMLEMTMLNNSKVLILLLVNFMLIWLTELETIFISAFASHLWVKNSEIGSENSQPSSMNVQLIGSFPGHKRHWSQWHNHLSRNSKN